MILRDRYGQLACGIGIHFTWLRPFIIQFLWYAGEGQKTQGHGTLSVSAS